MMRLEELNPFWSGLLNKMGNYRKIWVCRKCGQTIFSAKRPIKCVNGICDSGEDGSSARTYNYRGLFIGTESDMDNQLNGSLDNICIINHSLTQTEVTALYSSGMYPNASTPCDVLYLSGETGNTTDAYDENNLVDGEWEQANRFDGVNDYINTNLVPNGNEITISTWFQTNELGATQGLISLYDDSSNGIYTRFDSGNVLRAGIYDSGAGYTVVGSISVIDTNWHHFALTFNNISKNVIMYVDGVVDQNLTSSNAVKYSTTGMAISRYKNDVAGAELNGSIDDVMIFNRSLTSAEINSLYYGYDRTQHNYNYEFKGE